MRWRNYTLHLRCHHEGCEEWSFYSYSTKRDYNEAIKRGTGRDWKCLRHNDDKLLTPQRLTANRTIVVGKSQKYPELQELFFDDGHGFSYGASWKAFARDFPEGTQIVETVQVILPTKSRDEK